MRKRPGAVSSVLAGVALAGLVAGIGLQSREARACVSGCFHLYLSFPTVSCAGDGFTRTSSSLINNTSSSRWFFCEVPANSKTDFGWFALALSINVTPGTSCFVVAGDALGNGWSVPAPVTRHFSGFDEHSWSSGDLTGSGGRNVSIQCFVPPGGKGFQYFEQTIWEGIQ